MITLSAFIRDQSTKSVIGPIADGIDFKSLPKQHSIEVVPAGGKVGSIRMTLNTQASYESLKPYIFGGDNSDLRLGNGDYLFAATAYEDRAGKGTPIASLKLRFSIGKVQPPPPNRTTIKGICENFSAPMTKILKPLQDAKTKAIRGWVGIDWEKLPSAKFFDDAMDWHNKGLKTIGCFTTKQPPKNAQQAKDWFSRAWDVGNKAIDFWEIGNEPNLNTVEARRSEEKAYWIGTTKSHFDSVLVPASAVLKPKGATLIGPSISKDLVALGGLVKWGLPQLVHYAGYHPYGYNAKEHVDNLKGAYGICGALPIAATEWNFHAADAGMWSRGIGTCWAAAKAYCAIACYYRGQRNDQPAGKHGIFNVDFGLHQPYFDTFRAME